VHELVDAALDGQPGIDVAARIHADTVNMAALQAGERHSLWVVRAEAQAGPSRLVTDQNAVVLTGFCPAPV